MTAVKVSIGLIALNLLLNLTLIWTPLGVAGLAWSTAFCAVVQTIILSILLARRVGPILDRDVLRSAGMTVLISVVVAVSTMVVLALIDPQRNATSWWWQLGSLCAAVASGMFVAFVVASLMRMPELGWVLLGRER